MHGGGLLLDLENLGVTVARGPADLIDKVVTTAAVDLTAQLHTRSFALILAGFEGTAVGGTAVGGTRLCAGLAAALDLVAANAVAVRRRLDEAARAAPQAADAESSAAPEVTILVSRATPSPAELRLLVDLVADPGGAAALLPACSPDSLAGVRVLELSPGPAGSDALVARLRGRSRVAARPAVPASAARTSAAPASAAPRSVERASAAPASAAPRSAAPASAVPRSAERASAAPASAAPRSAAPASTAPGRKETRAAKAPAATGQAGLRIGVLGPLTINGQPAALLPAQSQLIVALALHGDAGLSNKQLCDLLGADPGHRRPSDSLRQLIVRTRRQLGRASDGLEWIEHRGGGKYALHRAATLDWTEFEAIAARGIALRDAGQLAQALAMVRGQPFTGCYYWWLDQGMVENVRARIVDAAETLGKLSLAAGQPAQAARAARTGLVVDETAERLWRVLMRAEHAAGNMAGVREAWARCLHTVADISADGQPETATVAVYQQLGGS